MGFLSRKLIARRRVLFGFLSIAATFYLFYQVFSISRLGEQLSAEAYDKQNRKGQVERQDAVILPEMPAIASNKKQGMRIRGVRSPDVKLYIPTSNGNFRCVTSSHQEIPYNNVNDDYCDCQDGSDEPSTSACSNGRFFCDFEATAIKGIGITSSRVNDGVCDCCDGSDEWQNVTVPLFEKIEENMQKKIGRYQVPCRNVCAHAAI